ncbi:MAG: NTP transferase domain-containing protein [Candidatus Krumholzibacteria bacterium]|nr:NTP transferase domain-containing protein [Candidatus Krumholzibacteria bacterium]
MIDRMDCVVILARGASRRMGQPKGLLPCPGTDGRSFLATIAASYVELDLPMVVVTTPNLVEPYREIVADVDGCRVVGHGPGGDTARTVRQGALAGDAQWTDQWTHLWIHPVDMPLIKTETLRQLWHHSLQNPQASVRPGFAGRPGHPVICPASGLMPLWDHGIWQEAAMREVIALSRQLGHIEKSVLVPLEDPGVVTDFDSPADLDRFDNIPFSEDSDGSA